MFEHNKPKNDDKAKRQPNQKMLLAAIGVTGLLVGLGLMIVMNVTMPDNTGLPTARLLYTSDSQRISLNLQTGEKASVGNVNSTYGSPKVSPDGKWIVSWQMITEYYFWELRLQTSEREAPTSLGLFMGAGGDLSWSADSKEVLFHAYPDTVTTETMTHSDEEIWTINIETQALTRLTDNHFIDGGAVYSPDGSTIVYTSSMDGYNRLYLMDAVTHESRLLSPDTYGYMPAWSPDGKWIAFWTNHQNYDGDIWIIRADGTGAQAITTDRNQDTDPAWLP